MGKMVFTHIRNLEIWNRLKLLWAFSSKADKLWSEEPNNVDRRRVQSVHMYFVKGRDPGSCSYKNLSWMLRQVRRLSGIQTQPGPTPKGTEIIGREERRGKIP